MTEVVLDASALMALFRKEPGADAVAVRLSDAVMSAVNYSELLKKVIERGGAAEAMIELVGGFAVQIIPFDASLAARSAALYLQTKEHGLSFADRACLALGLQRGASVLTTDRKWRVIDLPIKVMLIRNEH